MKPIEYAQLLYEVMEGKGDEEQSQIIERFKSLLIKNKDAHLAMTITKELEEIQHKNEREKITYVTSASELSAEQREALEEIYQDQKEYSTNPSLLGGIAVRTRDKIYNATLRKKIEALKSLL